MSSGLSAGVLVSKVVFHKEKFRLKSIVLVLVMMKMISS